jgi:hypothetical protein
MFSTTLSSDPAYAFTNPPPSGTAQAFSVEVTGGTTNFTNDTFATTLYAGTGAAQTITNGLDLSTDGGLVWIKERGNSRNHHLVDTERGIGDGIRALRSNLTDAEYYQAGYDAYEVTSANSDGFSLGLNLTNETNRSGSTYVSWAFKKQSSFFDIVTYTGDGTDDRTVSHNLGSTPGMVIVKRTSGADSWMVLHRSLPSNNLLLNLTVAASSLRIKAMDSTTFTLNTNAQVNGSGESYVAYIFGHDTSDDSLIKCGSYTKTGSSQDIDLGWSPEWLMLKRTNSTSSWYIMDTKRGFTTDAQAVTLKADSSDAEGGLGNVVRTSTGFNVTSDAGEEWIYMAIRGDAATDSAITWPSSVKWPSGLAPTTPAAGTKDLFTFLTTDGGTTYYGKKAAEGLA